MGQLQTYGLGMGSSLILMSFAMRSVFSPFILLSQINATKNLLLAPEMERYRDELTQAYKAGNQAKVGQLNAYMKDLKHKHNMKNIYGAIPLTQLPFVIYFFWTLQEMSYNVDIYPGMTTDGFLWFKDLSEADPYFILPVLFASATFTTIHKSPNSAQAAGPMGQYFKYMKYLVFLGIPVTSTFPAAIVLNWTMMSVFQLGINSLVYTRTGRKLIGIPQYLPGSILEKHNLRLESPVIKPKVFQHKPTLPKK
jgi:YidC/Oxa1 family membrane protein insertase